MRVLKISVISFLACLFLDLWFNGQASGYSSEQSQELPVLRAGAATSNITPMLGASIIGSWNPHPSTHVHDELHVRCLILDDGDMRVAFAIVDNVAIPRQVYDQARRIVEQETDLSGDHILMAATHTHSATSARGTIDPRGLSGVQSEFTPVSGPTDSSPFLDDYQRFVARRIADGIRRAIHNLEPVEVAWGVGEVAGQVFNRRWYMKPGTELRNPFGGTDKVRTNPGVGNPDLLKPAGPTDSEVAFLYVRSLEGRPVALLANYSLHYVGGTRSGEISSDYFGMFADRIAEILQADRLDPPFVGILSNGTSGDINNIDFTGATDRETAPYAQIRRVADVVAAEVYRQLKTVEFRRWVPLAIRQDEIPLQVRQPAAAQIERARSILQQPESDAPGSLRERSYAGRILQILEEPSSASIILQTVRIGDLGIAAIPAEVFAEIGLEIKEKSPFETTFTISLANDQWVYLPTPRQHELGGYETWLGTNRLEIEASSKIVERLIQLFNEIKD